MWVLHTVAPAFPQDTCQVLPRLHVCDCVVSGGPRPALLALERVRHGGRPVVWKRRPGSPRADHSRLRPSSDFFYACGGTDGVGAFELSVGAASSIVVGSTLEPRAVVLDE